MYFRPKNPPITIVSGVCVNAMHQGGDVGLLGGAESLYKTAASKRITDALGIQDAEPGLSDEGDDDSGEAS